MHKIAVMILFIFICALPVLAQSDESVSKETGGETTRLGRKPSSPQVHNWTGFYIGGNGYGSRDRVSADANLLVTQISGLFVASIGIIIVPGTERTLASSGNHTGWGGGGQAGYQWQSGKVVFGVEGDFDPFHRTASVSQSQQLVHTVLQPIDTIDVRRDVRLSRELSIRGRIGVAFGSNLVYGTGGYANARARVMSIDSFTDPGGPGQVSGCLLGFSPPCIFNGGPEGPVVTTASESHNMGGWTVGGGLDHALGRHYSIGVEYRHTSLGSKVFTLATQTTTNTGPEKRGTNGGTGVLGSVSTGPTRISLRSDAISVRFNFHF